jgi:hypothetical protein
VRTAYFTAQQLCGVAVVVVQQSQAQPTQAQLPGEQPWSQAQTSQAQLAPQQQSLEAVVEAPPKMDNRPARIKLKIDMVNAPDQKK